VTTTTTTTKEIATRGSLGGVRSLLTALQSQSVARISRLALTTF